jgi:hypothetical protein
MRVLPKQLASGLMNSSQVVIFFNQGNGQFTRSFFASGANTNVMISADLKQIPLPCRQ